MIINSVDDIMSYKDDDIGYILEVDVHYPKELHDLQNDYPLAPELMCVNSDMVSDVSNDSSKVYHGKNVIGEKSPNLLLTFYDKEKYAVHIRNLKYYLEKE